jgi:uncharacterized protein (TIGR03067 family)
MIRKLFLAVALVALFASYSHSGGDKDKYQSIEGTWLPTAAEFAGEKFPDELRKTMKLVVNGETYTVTVGKSIDKGTLKLDLATKPKAMDIIGTEGPNKGKTFLAIYERSGERLRICYDLDGKNRPTEFKTKAGTKTFLVTYEREKP